MADTVELATDVASSPQEEIQVVAFQLGNEEYAVDILHVLEINRLLHITRVPRANQFIEGVINLRGNIIPIINLHKKFNLQATGDDEEKRIIVFKFDDIAVGVIVDKVSEVLHISRNQIEEASDVYKSFDSEFIKGIAKVDERLLILLDLQNMLSV
ncbi:MAG: chemotaxis protein CheW [Syntrophomonadaceae bacterium]|jgi:purine-binding chemotaxis protein CheW